tara:strand:+ start:443 stop:832 length:390 start_codon:yes stop_codon:yes gene_type:complete
MSKVLLIEDDRFLIDDLRTFIEYEGHECTIFKGPDEVMDHMSDVARFDVVILDIMMSRGKYLQGEDERMETGELLFRRIREVAHDLPIIIISAKNFDDMQIDFAREANVDTVSKPFDSTASELVGLIPR